MRIVPLQQVECAILHDEHRPVPVHVLNEVIGHIAADLGFTEEPMALAGTTEDSLMVRFPCKRLSLQILQVDEPLAPEGFRTALACTYTNAIFPDARTVIDRHRAYTVIVLGKEPLAGPMPGNIMQILGETFIADMAFTTSDEVRQAMSFCRRLAEAVLAHRQASAVHWCMSDALIPPPLFDLFKKNEGEMLLGTKPVLLSQDCLKDGHVSTDCRFRGTPYLIGKMLVFDKAPVPLAWMIQKVHAFIRTCLQRDTIIPHMETFRIEGDSATLAVLHQDPENPEDMRDPGEVHLRVVHAPEFGIDGSLQMWHRSGGKRGAVTETNALHRQRGLSRTMPSSLRGSLPHRDARRPGMSSLTASLRKRRPLAPASARAERSGERILASSHQCRTEDIVAIMRARLKRRMHEGKVDSANGMTR